MKVFGKDKLYHLIAGFIIGFILAFWKPEVGLIAGVAAGIGKEIYDKYIKKSDADPVDTLSTILGAMLGIALSILLQNSI